MYPAAWKPDGYLRNEYQKEGKQHHAKLFNPPKL